MKIPQFTWQQVVVVMVITIAPMYFLADELGADEFAKTVGMPMAAIYLAIATYIGMKAKEGKDDDNG